MKTIALTAALMCGILLFPHVNAQVEINQSTITTGFNGLPAKTTTKEISNSKSCAEQTTTTTLTSATIKVTTTPKFAVIEYCKDTSHDIDPGFSPGDRCHTYILYNNGTMTAGGEKTK
jgi:hypothetical protein